MKLSASAIALKDKYGTLVQFCSRFNPDIQLKLLKIGADYVECYKFDYPSLSQASGAYTVEGIVSWLKLQFENLNDYIGVRDKMTIGQLNELAMVFYSECSFLKISEVSLFFTKLKAGKFGEFYGSVDPIRIMSAKNEFLSRRYEALERQERIENLRQAEINRIEWSKNAVSYQEYRKQKRERIRAKLKNLKGRKIKRIKQK